MEHRSNYLLNVVWVSAFLNKKYYGTLKNLTKFLIKN